MSPPLCLFRRSWVVRFGTLTIRKMSLRYKPSRGGGGEKRNDSGSKKEALALKDEEPEKRGLARG